MSAFYVGWFYCKDFVNRSVGVQQSRLLEALMFSDLDNLQNFNIYHSLHGILLYFEIYLWSFDK